MKNNNKRITFSVNSSIYKKYKKLCDKKGWVISKQIEDFMRKEIAREEVGK